MLTDLLLLAAIVIFIIAIGVGHYRTKQIDWIAIGLAVVTLVAFLDRRVL